MHIVSDQNWTVEAWEGDSGGRRWWWRCGKEMVVEVWEGDGGGGVERRWWWRCGKETVVEVWERDSEYMLVGKKIE